MDLAISRKKKEALVETYRQILKENTSLIMTDYSGLTVKEMEMLRARIREIGGEFHVVKNRLAKRAFQEAGLPEPEQALDGPTAIGVISEDVPGLAKAIVDLAKETEILRIKAGVIDGRVLDAAEITRLAELPPLPVVQAQLLGLIQTPAQQIAGVLAATLQGLARVIKAYSEQEAAAAS